MGQDPVGVDGQPPTVFDLAKLERHRRHDMEAAVRWQVHERSSESDLRWSKGTGWWTVHRFKRVDQIRERIAIEGDHLRVFSHERLRIMTRLERYSKKSERATETGMERRPPQPANSLTNLGNLAPWVGLEPTTNRLTADCSTIELPRNRGIA